MRNLFLTLILLTAQLLADAAERAVPTLKAFSLMNEGSGKLIANPALENARNFDAFDQPIGARMPPPPAKRPKAADVAPELKKGDKFMSVDPATARSDSYRKQVQQNERVYYDQLHQRKKEYYKQIDSRNLLIE